MGIDGFPGNGDEIGRPAPGPANGVGDTYFHHMVRLAADGEFNPQIRINCRLEAAEHLVDLGHAANETAGLLAVVAYETRLYEEQSNGPA
ncbi:MAG TPA: hypothetical protein VIJ68_00565 [Candidatus Saccharimonadales bacterium]